MKRNQTIIMLFAISMSMFFTACVEDNNFKVPENLGVEENLSLNALLDSIQNNQVELKSIKDLKSLYNSGNDPLKIVSDIVIKGYVVSSDAKGNYFREFYMQDAPENPSAGIKIAINLTNSYNKFSFGREVYIRLKNLYLGETNSGDGVISIGGKVNLTDIREVESITQNQIENHLFRSITTETIVPKIVTLGGLDDISNIGTFVAIENAFFSSDLKGKTFVNPVEDFDTKRKIETCQGPGFVSSFVETSSFASFANNALPEGGGTIKAVVSRDFGGDFTVLVLNTADDVFMADSRCTPSELTDFSTILLQQDFEATSGEIDIPNWTNFIEVGSKKWRSYTDVNSLSIAANIGSYRSGDESTISWLITEDVNLDATLEEYLSFETSTSFADGSTLEVLISDNWNGNEATITTANWMALPAKIAANNDDYNSFINSTFIDLSNYSGTIYIAFKYTGNGNDIFDGTYELDNINIIAK
ncbi:hypothetical protein SAMN05216503_3073 [Polaribacter sp. KT25b]|uniref:DUF5689 domain-containing protein n=1 Tax=Polaribacter sp. KT25b TaxID=1855336 RepID=UPI00087DBB8A|nr:DUF5689 domain-containing protein [Polaribacter sp. KT25b]SDS44229.1 hypothetical protein SAMN05216503_3073 [Polaribacter sp. KT25b]